MGNGRPKPLLELTDAEAAQLESFARSRLIPASLCLQALIMLTIVGGESSTDIAGRLGLIKALVGKWRASFLEKRIAGFYVDYALAVCAVLTTSRSRS